jgi:hypothetical protein
MRHFDGVSGLMTTISGTGTVVFNSTLDAARITVSINFPVGVAGCWCYRIYE